MHPIAGEAMCSLRLDLQICIDPHLFCSHDCCDWCSLTHLLFVCSHWRHLCILNDLFLLAVCHCQQHQNNWRKLQLWHTTFIVTPTTDLLSLLSCYCCSLSHWHTSLSLTSPSDFDFSYFLSAADELLSSSLLDPLYTTTPATNTTRNLLLYLLLITTTIH